jgi:hypothetical protein
MDFDYKKYSLENLENWMHDAMSAGEATPYEIYDVIVSVVKENYYTYKQKASQAYELLGLLNSGVDNNKYQDYLSEILSCDKDDRSPECQSAWDDFWQSSHQEYLNTEEDKIVKWQLPVQVDGLTGDCYVNFPDDLLEIANLKEGDQLEWVDNYDGSYTLKKHNVHN